MPYEWMTSHPHSTCNDSFSFDDEQLLDNVKLAQMFVTMKEYAEQGRVSLQLFIIFISNIIVTEQN